MEKKEIMKEVMEKEAIKKAVVEKAEVEKTTVETGEEIAESVDVIDIKKIVELVAEATNEEINGDKPVIA